MSDSDIITVLIWVVFVALACVLYNKWAEKHDEKEKQKKHLDNSDKTE